MGTDEAQALLRRLEERGVRLLLEGDALRVSAPKGVLDERLRAELTANKPALIALLRNRTPGALARAPREGRLPVSAAQQRLWFLDQVAPGNAAYNIAGGLRLRGRFDLAALNGAFDDLIARHDALRTRIGERGGAPWLEVTDAARATIDFIDLSGEPPAQAETTVFRLANELRRTGLDMAHGPLSKLLLIRLADDHHVLASATHHVISDGWSLNLMLNEAFQLYQARVAGTGSPLAPLTFSPIDYAAWEGEQIGSRRFDDSLAYWQQALHGAPALLELPTDRPRPAAPTFRGGRLTRFIDPALIARVKSRAQRQNATAFVALMTCWQAVLHRYSGQDDIVVGTPLANRDRPEFEGLMGCLINNVVVRGRLSDNPTLAEFLDQIREQALAAFEHGQVPFDLVVERLNPQRSTSHAPVFQVLFTHLAFPVSMPPMAGLTLEPITLEPFASRFDLTCEMSVDPFGEHANMQRVDYEFSLDLFDDSSIARLHDHFEQMLAAFAADASQRIDDVPLALSASDREALGAWSCATADRDRSLCAHQLLEASAIRAPGDPALTVGGETLSYGDLDRRANRLARLLQAQGVKPRDLVAFCLDRTEDIPVTMAAAFKAGAAYVPLDPTHPQDRLRYVVEDSQAACVVTLRRFASLFDESTTRLVILDAAQDALGALSDDPLATVVDPDDLAYVIYTSGSTGRPKGVEVEHRNLVAFLDAMAREPGFRESDVLLTVTTPAFDISGLEIWLPLMKGARIVMASRVDVIDGSRLAELIRAHGVTVLQATPATWRLLLDAGWEGKADLKALCGGEAMPRDLAASLLGKVGELWNMYGPTETTIWSTLSRVVDAAGPIPIGRPIANTRVRVLDAKGRQVPIGVVGELCIGGEGVARGYRNRPDLTSEKFVVLDPLGDGPERLYRTGDLARFQNDGQLVFIGRRDHQVKVRGYRIELGEIEAVLAACRGVRECTVIVREDAPGDQRLTAYVTADPNTAFDAEAAKAALRERLPEYMTPGVFVVLDALPLTPNGKIDRAALPRPAAARPSSAGQGVDLMNPDQRRVAQIWKDLLNVDHVGLNDNFFDLGGHSLLLVKLHARLKTEFAIDLPLVELFQRTTVATQADRMNSPGRASDALERARGRAERLARA
jgi:amino acid adenylation domain-containing protein